MGMADRVRRLWREPVYEGPLSELVAATVRQDAVDEIVDRALSGETVEGLDGNDGATPYIEKLLSEEVEKQFDDPKRPFIELVLNAIDARPEDVEDGDYSVRVRTKRDGFVVADEGDSMGIESMLEHFLLPFSSEKDAFEDIGRFGVGFYSNLSYCLEDDARLVVKTNDGDEAYTATFWSDSGDVSDLRVRLDRGGRWKRGTKVAVHGADMRDTDLDGYLSEYLEYFDPDRARVTNWWLSVNDEPDGMTYRSTVPFETEEGTYEQELRMTLDPDGEGGVRLYSQGVYITGGDSECGTMHMSFPSAVGLVEGRNEFREDGLYERAVEGFYSMLADAAGDTDAAVMRELVPALDRELDGEMPEGTKRELASMLFDDTDYVLTSTEALAGNPGEYRAACRFFGEDVEDRIYGAADRGTVPYWEEVVGGMDDLLADRTEELVRGGLDDLRAYGEEHGLALDGLDTLYEQDTRMMEEYCLVEVDGEGVSPFFGDGGTVYVNVSHPAVQEDGFASRYGNFVNLKRARDRREDRIEDEVQWL